MPQSDLRYSKLRWVLTVAGLLMYVVDMGTDVGLAVKYFNEKHFVWAGLTLVFLLVGLLVTQIFSSAWYRDDMNDILIKAEGKTSQPDMSKCGLTVLHLLGLGIFIRYYHLLKQGFKVLATNSYTLEEIKHKHHTLFCLAADLSLLKLFESFLESVPQLLLQLYIVLGHHEFSVIQYLSMGFSFLNIAWTLVDYRRCLRKSLPNIKEMPSGIPTAIYLIYKICTITSHILSYAIFLILSIYSTVGLTIIWLLGTAWAHFLQTDFCSSRGLEFLFRAVTGVILTFTFFNVKGQGTRDAMIVYYFFHSMVNLTGPLLLAVFRPELLESTTLLCISVVILGGSVTGLVCLVLYYLCMHPQDKCQEADEVDSLGKKTETMIRMHNFLLL